ncbi:MAG: hypothetical protein WBN88_15235 [Anderseniella sp.]
MHGNGVNIKRYEKEFNISGFSVCNYCNYFRDLLFLHSEQLSENNIKTFELPKNQLKQPIVVSRDEVIVLLVQPISGGGLSIDTRNQPTPHKGGLLALKIPVNSVDVFGSDAKNKNYYIEKLNRNIVQNALLSSNFARFLSFKNFKTESESPAKFSGVTVVIYSLLIGSIDLAKSEATRFAESCGLEKIEGKLGLISPGYNHACSGAGIKYKAYAPNSPSGHFTIIECPQSAPQQSVCRMKSNFKGRPLIIRFPENRIADWRLIQQAIIEWIAEKTIYEYIVN